MDLCIVIPARNEEAHLGEQLDALLRQEWEGEWQVVVVDNGSSDRTAAVVERYAAISSRVGYLLAADRADQSFAANAGVAATSASAVVFCDADDIVAEGWLAAMGNGLAEHEVVTGPNELKRLNPPWLASSRGSSGEAAVGNFSGIFPSVRGNNYGVRAEVWTRVGRLKEAFFPVADMEFSLRCWLHGVEIVGLPDAVVHYRFRQSTRDLWRQGLAYGSHRPMIARMLREAGKPRPARLGGWKSWVLLVVTAPALVTRGGRARWVWIAGNRIGQLVGSVRHRTVML